MANVDDDLGVIADTISMRASDGRQISIKCWQPVSGDTPSAVVHILHGLGEHSARYDGFAEACASAGLVVAAHDHRGHGSSSSNEFLGHFADNDGWNKVIDDALLVRRTLLERFGGIPLVVLGHSMGSFIAQCSVMRDPEGVSLLILSASTNPARIELKIARLLARLEVKRIGKDARSKFLDKISFGDFNRRFAPNRTTFDWLSRDQDEVDKYIADPACGAIASSQLWHDLTGGMLEITTDKSIHALPGELPVLILGGELDPVGGKKGLTSLADRYRKAGIKDVTLRIYVGGRHEMLNEVNRDEVTLDIIRWVLERK